MIDLYDRFFSCFKQIKFLFKKIDHFLKLNALTLFKIIKKVLMGRALTITVQNTSRNAVAQKVLESSPILAGLSGNNVSLCFYLCIYEWLSLRTIQKDIA